MNSTLSFVFQNPIQIPLSSPTNEMSGHSYNHANWLSIVHIEGGIEVLA